MVHILILFLEAAMILRTSLQDFLDSKVKMYIVRLWYTTTMIHYVSFGVYIPSWASFRATTKLQGFSCGDTIDDDIPSQFNAKIMIWDQWLANALQHSTKSFVIPVLKGYNCIH